jgi:hypothetical protein
MFIKIFDQFESQINDLEENDLSLNLPRQSLERDILKVYIRFVVLQETFIESTS